MKVAEARAEGLDTLDSFRQEMNQYRHDLAAPYLADSTYMFQLLDEAHKRAGEEVEAKHIMLFKTRDAAQNIELRQRADSLLKVLKAGGDFEDLAARFSGDRGSNTKGGNMGYITAMRLPYNFETAAYTLADGELSDVVESPVGYHILKGGKHRPSSGKVEASHILIMTQNDPSKEPGALRLADSLYNIVKNDPSKFEDLARRFSDDKGSGRQGGKLGWFGRGEMVSEFDSVAFAIPDGSISEPFKTRFGYHIIYRQDHKGAPTKEELKPAFMSLIASGQDPRTKMIKDHQTRNLAKKHKSKVNAAVLDQLKNDASIAGLDSAFYAKWTADPLNSTELLSIQGKKYPVSGLMSYLGYRMNPYGETSKIIVSDMFDSYYNVLLVDAEEEDLMKKHPEYANLYNEYVEGSLLYEVSLKNVWDKASKDEAGLKDYFEKNRSKYRWSEPRAKGYLVQASSDSVADLIKKRSTEIGRDSLINTIRKEFSKDVLIIKVLEAKGNNPMIDNLLFGENREIPENSRYSTFFMIDPRVIIEPEDLNDVKGLVTSDYQNVLQKEWEKDLVSKYPVTVNEKVLKKVKPIK